jgi:hypothetical protein
MNATAKTLRALMGFNATAQVAVMLVFTDKTEALVNIGIP